MNVIKISDYSVNLDINNVTYASAAAYAQTVGPHNHSAAQIIDLNENISSVKDLIFKVPTIQIGYFYHLKIQFSNTDDFSSITNVFNTSINTTRFKVFTGQAMIAFPSTGGLGIQFSEQQVKFDTSNITEKYYRFQWLVGEQSAPSDPLQGGRYGYGQTDGILNIFDVEIIQEGNGGVNSNTYISNDFNRIIVSSNAVISENDFAIVDTDCNITLPICSSGIKVAVGATQEADDILIAPYSGDVIIKDKTTSSTQGVRIDKTYGYVEFFGTESGWKIARLS